MTSIRLIPLPIHAALRMVTGILTMAAPFLFGFGPAAAVVAVVLGAVVTGVALSGVGDDRGRATVPISTIHAFDYGIVLGTLGAAIVLGAGGDDVAAVVLSAIALIELGGNMLTKYSSR